MPRAFVAFNPALVRPMMMARSQTAARARDLTIRIARSPVGQQA
jgi:hypothetical protein